MSAQPEITKHKIVVASLMIVTLALMLVFLQQKFDEGDHEKALKLLASKAPDAGWSVGEELLQRAGSGRLDCQPKLLSSFQGTLEVKCYVGDADPYRFHVDLVRQSVVATDARTRELVESAQHKAAAVHDAGG